jgi:hypothetical protein
LNRTNGFVDPLAWLNNQTPQCQNGTTERYLPNGRIPSHPDGTLIQTFGDRTVYVLANGQRRAIPSTALLYSLYGQGRGFDFRDVVTVSSQELSSYARGSDLKTALPSNGRNAPDGRLIRQWGGDEISIVSHGVRRPFTSLQAFLDLGYALCNVAGVSDYSSYPAGVILSH